MKFCPKCSASIPDDATYCPECGTPLPGSRCPRCGRPLVPGRECLYCASAPGAPGMPQSTAPLTMWEYMGLILLAFVPLIGLIFMIVWACSSENIHRRRFAQGALLARTALLVAYFLLMIFFASLLGSAFDAFQQFESGNYYGDFSQFTSLARLLAHF